MSAFQHEVLGRPPSTPGHLSGQKKRHLIYQAPRLVALNHDCGLWAMCLTSLSLSFLACKMRIMELP